MTLDELCALVETRASSLGHRLEPWDDSGEEPALARVTSCTICGRAAYARIERGLVGAAGAAYSQPCGRRVEQERVR
jgi:hypothetical protein